METLVAVAQHKNQYCGRTKSHARARYGSSPFRDYRGINCRTFHSETGVRSSPLTLRSYPTPVTRKVSSLSPKTPSSPANLTSNEKTYVKNTQKSSPIPILGGTSDKECAFTEQVREGSRSLSELWAGPAYSNSPPPSSLPIPKFSLPPKTTFSLDLPDSSPEIEIPPTAKSAPSSPTRDQGSPARGLLLTADSATKTLRRILNLNIDDDDDGDDDE